MDRIIRIVLCLLAAVIVVLAGTATYTAYTEAAYRNTLTGTASYSCTITTNSPLYNMTLFIPIPADRTGNSQVVSAFSSRAVQGIPGDWETALFDTGKSTLVKFIAPAVIPPEGSPDGQPFTVMITADTSTTVPIDTRDPVVNSALFLPVQDPRSVSCTGAVAGAAACSAFTTQVYAAYDALPDARISIESELIARNTWTVFEPGYNEYCTGIHLDLSGPQHGWSAASGSLASGIGSYDVPGGA